MSQHNWRSIGVLVAFLVGLFGTALSAQPPATDLYLLPLLPGSADKPVFGDLQRLTDRDDYDNQPHFLPDGKSLLYTSQRGEQTEIVLLDLIAGTERLVTETVESEYSPTPHGDGFVSVIRVEADGRQRLWSVPLGDGQDTQLLPDVEPVGYHAWGPDGDLLLFVLGEPPTLQWADADGRTRVLAESPGRSLHRIPGEDAFSFVDKAGDEWWLRKLDRSSGETSGLIAMPSGMEDVAWDPTGRVWVANGARLLRFCPECGGGWRLMTHLGKLGLGEVTRLAISPDGFQMALVATR